MSTGGENWKKKNTLMLENSRHLTSTFVAFRLHTRSDQERWKYGGSYRSEITACMCFHFHVLFAVSPVTMNSAVKLHRGVNSAEGDPVLENRKVINLPQRASGLQRSSQRLQLSQLPTFLVSVFPPFRQIRPQPTRRV